ncbi:AarF/ABC1/UbiB kinase family protein [Planomonospora sp. ID67723]|uniref:ABC1 kinase family protein n=1 Tax=Planomonospora sp. ID67723 TaxID=2738134 RepID=UPI0018C40B7D|nr:AarF/UbiB family protein [Planomonospora sp. ID67723]MBG0831210.1 AarF/ABC1/UbiB kinase family protein [Planomonospora sp. ID67723]
MSSRRLLTVTGVLAELAGAGAARALSGRGRRKTGDHDDPVAAQAVRQALERLGPFYVKAGQMLSTRPDIVSPATMAELAKLHDHVSVAPFSIFEPVLAAELGPGWERRFDRIEHARPLGSASLAQAYKVVLPGGGSAVLKIQRPDIRSIVLDDMAMMRKAARLVARCFPDFNAVIDVESMLNVIFDAMEAELDFTVEAANMNRARRLVEEFEYLDVPEVIWATPKVLVQSLAPGRSIREVDRQSLPEKQRVGIGRDLLAFMYRGYFVDRFFHADPHPGNILVAPGEKAHLIDWGMVGRVDRRMSMTMMTVLLSLAHNDGPGLARAWVELGKATPWADIAGFAGDMAILVPKIATASLEDLDFGVTLTSVLKYSTRRGIQTSPVVSLLGKSFANIEGSVRYLAPELALTEVFEEELRDILIRLAAESVSEIQAARTAMDLMIGNTLAPEQFRGLIRDMANRDFTVRIGSLRARGARRGDTKGLLAAAIAVGGLLWWSRRKNVPPGGL